MKRLIGLFGVFLLVVAACGGGSDEGSGDDGGDQPTTTRPADDGGDRPATTQPADDDGDRPATTQPTEDDDPPPPTTEAAPDDSGGEGPSTATVTIGGETYEFSSEGAPIAQCLPDLFGTFVLNLPLADGGDGRIEIIALHEGTDPAVVEVDNRVHVSLGDLDWWADPLEINLGPDESALSRVDSVDVSGSSLTGTASWMGRDVTVREWMSETGTFEATCGEARTS